MTQKLIKEDPRIGERLKEEIARKGINQKILAERCYMTPQNINNIVKGKTALTRENAEKFGEILGVRREYLLGLDDFRTPDLAWLKSGNSVEAKKDQILEHSLDFWGYRLISLDPMTEIDESNPEVPETVITGVSAYKIRIPSGEIVEISEAKYSQLKEDLIRSARRLIREALDPED